MRKYFRRLYGLCGLVLLLSVAGPAAPVAAATADISGAVTQSYNADPSVLAGMIVELKPKDQTTVVPLASKDIRNMLGVVVPVNAADIVLTPKSVPAQQVLVASSGRYNLLVSNQNGPIKAGDYLAVSALDGIGMKANADQSEIIGRASTAFSGNGSASETVSLKNSQGRTTTVAIGHIPVDVRLAPNPQFKNASDLPGFLTRAANSVANKPVSPPRIYLSAIVLLATLFITGNMFYSSIRSGIVAIGRNPLAKKAIGRGLVQTITAALIIFIAGVFAVYLILNF
jgi:hypothetical protein